jgi:hypothetical protein
LSLVAGRARLRVREIRALVAAEPFANGGRMPRFRAESTNRKLRALPGSRPGPGGQLHSILVDYERTFIRIDEGEVCGHSRRH